MRSDFIGGTLERTAGVILEPLDLSSEEIDEIIQEWCLCDFEVGQTTRSLAKLQRIACEFIMKREGDWEKYRQEFSRRPLHKDLYAIKAEE